MQDGRRDGRDERVLIVGAGLVGSLLSIYLARRGLRVEVFDRCSDPRRVDLSSQRASINLSLCERGFQALDRVGIGNAVRACSVPSYGRLIHDERGSVAYQPYGDNGECTWAILRNDLNRLLIDFAEKSFGVAFRFGERCLDLEPTTTTIQFEDTATGLVHNERATRVFGADGVFSKIRSRLERLPRFNYSQLYLDHGYTELNMPSIEGAPWADHRLSVHLWPRGGYLLLGLPNLDGSLVCSLHLPLEGETSFEALHTEERLLRFLASSFPDAVDYMPNAAGDYFGHRINYLVTIRCFPWTFEGRVALIGDAAHAIVPFFAQGVNAGFEDCLVLDQCLDEHGSDWKAAFRAYETRRKPDADAVSDLSLQHFHELRDHVGRPTFHLKKRIERRVSELYPERFVPLYSMVTFKATPYAEALRRGRELEALIQRIMDTPAIADKTEIELRQLIDQAVATV
jgi:kynurenine 3-monooxygenase